MIGMGDTPKRDYDECLLEEKEGKGLMKIGGAGLCAAWGAAGASFLLQAPSEITEAIIISGILVDVPSVYALIAGYGEYVDAHREKVKLEYNHPSLRARSNDHTP